MHAAKSLLFAALFSLPGLAKAVESQTDPNGDLMERARALSNGFETYCKGKDTVAGACEEIQKAFTARSGAVQGRLEDAQLKAAKDKVTAERKAPPRKPGPDAQRAQLEKDQAEAADLRNFDKLNAEIGKLISNIDTNLMPKLDKPISKDRNDRCYVAYEPNESREKSLVTQCQAALKSTLSQNKFNQYPEKARKRLTTLTSEIVRLGGRAPQVEAEGASSGVAP